MLFQGGALFDSLPVWQNVAFRLRQARKPLSRAEARALAVEKLGRVGLGPEVADLYPGRAVGRHAEARRPRPRHRDATRASIFFDEPTAGLDPIMAGVINDLIRELVDEMGATAVTITHDMTTVRTVADQVAMLHGGRGALGGAGGGHGRLRRPLRGAVHPRPGDRADRGDPVRRGGLARTGISGAPVARRPGSSAGAQAEGEGRRAVPSGRNRPAPAWAGAAVAPAKGQAGAGRFVDGQIGRGGGAVSLHGPSA